MPTRCRGTPCASFSGPDQPGALEAVAAAFAEADVVVHTARIETRDGRINDTFTVSDQIGRKLDAAAEDRVRRAVNGERRRRGIYCVAPCADTTRSARHSVWSR